MLPGYSADQIFRSQRTEAGLRYEKFVNALRDRYDGDRAFRAECERLVKRVAITPGSVHVNKLLSNVSIAYKNDEYIGERILGVVPVDNRSDQFLKWDKRNLMNAPDDLLSARSNANEVSRAYTTDNYSVKDYGLKDYVDDQTIRNSDSSFQQVLNMIEGLNEQIALKREMRIAAIVTTAASFSGNTSSLAGVEWNATSSGGIYTGGAPVNNIRTALASMWNGFGRTRKVAFMSLDVFNVLSNHQQIRGLFGLNDSGLATKDQIARYFGLDEMLVGEARYDSANIGQTAAYSRIWSNVFGVVRVAAQPSLRMAAFGGLFRLKGDPFTTEWFSPDEGKSGGHYAKVAVSEDYKVMAADTGYLFTGVIT